MTKPAFVVIAMLLAAQPGHAQIVVHDTSVTIRNTLTALLKEFLLNLQVAQHSQLRRMAQRLSVSSDLGKYAAQDAPRWRTHPGTDSDAGYVAYALQSALDFGDWNGLAYQSVSEPVGAAADLLVRLPFAARRSVEHQLSTIEMSDATSIATIHNAGRLRYLGRAELRAIEALERDVTDGSLEQSATAILDKISGASLLAARQRQARMELMIGLVEQLLIDTKRERETHAAALNMQLSQWRIQQSPSYVQNAGTGDALHTWRQP